MCAQYLLLASRSEDKRSRLKPVLCFMTRLNLARGYFDNDIIAQCLLRVYTVNIYMAASLARLGMSLKLSTKLHEKAPNSVNMRRTELEH